MRASKKIRPRSFKSTGQTVLPPDKERQADLERKVQETARRERAERERREEHPGAGNAGQGPTQEQE